MPGTPGRRYAGKPRWGPTGRTRGGGHLTRRAEMAQNQGKQGRFARLRELLADRALLLGRMTLSNGQESDFYFDCKRVTLHPVGAILVADAFLEVIDSLPEKPAAIGGLTLGADPILGAVMARAYQ